MRFSSCLSRSLSRGANQLRFFSTGARPFRAYGPTGKLTSVLVQDPQKVLQLKHESLALPELVLTERQLCDIELILNGGFSPLTGFMNQKDYQSVVSSMRLSDKDKTLWPIPITLDVAEAKIKQLTANGQSRIALKDGEGNIVAIMDISDVYKPNKTVEAKEVFGGDPEHPAISYLMNRAGDYYVGGSLTGLQLPPHYDHRDLRMTPRELLTWFEQQKWNKVVAFQTRNPLHRAHFELTVRAAADNGCKLLLHPVVGMTKPGDIDHHTRVKCYRKIMHKYEENTAKLAALPLAMRMAGPREAIWHAIIRKNHGATHFILGRDHAGPGSNSAGKDFYGPYEARDAALKHEKELGIKLVPFDMMVYVAKDQKYYMQSEVPKGEKVEKLSGTEVRRRLQTGEEIPAWFSFPEVASTLRTMHKPKAKQGFCVFFTGLSGSGKTTIANALMERLMEIDDRSVCMLDGDHVRQMLSSELGFTKDHRNLNIKRIGFVAAEVVKPGGAVICCPIAPYDESRRFARDLVSKNGVFILVHLSTTVAKCEERDRKGLYKKARSGLLKGMTGIDDPYETPSKAEIAIDTGVTSIYDAVEAIIKHLEHEGLVNTSKQT